MILCVNMYTTCKIRLKTRKLANSVKLVKSDRFYELDKSKKKIIDSLTLSLDTP